MKNPDRSIRSTGTLALVFIVSAAIAAPAAMLVGFPWVTPTQVAEAMNAPSEAIPQPPPGWECHADGTCSRVAARPTMTFEPEVITLAEADATAAAMHAVNNAQADADDAANLAIAPCDAERGLTPNDVAAAVCQSYVAHR